MTSVEIGLTISIIVIAALVIRLQTNPLIQEETKTKSVAELKRENTSMKADLDKLTEENKLVVDLRKENASLKAASEALAEQNTILRNRLQEAIADRQDLEITLAALRGELGRTTK